MKKILLLTFFCVASAVLYGQSPKRELRASWLTTVWAIDWPTTVIPLATGTNEAQRQTAITNQKAELCLILDSLKAANMNATFLQVRGMCDAFYASSYEPWSKYLTGTRGGNPGYDPLQYAVEQAHLRGLELHAWLNPYRYSSSSETHGNLPDDYYNTHPEWLLDYGSSLKILNPGLPEVVQQIKNVVADIVSRYDVDGIVFDDYFYAYGGTSATLDAATQALYKPSAMAVGDWRRENVNRMVAAVYDTIQTIKPFVTFGVSPFGTWTTDASVAAARGILLPAGVGATGNMYAEIYCDPVAWLEQGTVDYVSPQLYWTTYSAYPYGKLAAWWSDIANRFGRHFYASHSVSELSSSASAPADTSTQLTMPCKALSIIEQQAFGLKTTPAISKAVAAFPASEVGLQIDFNRTGDINDAPGSVFYATSKVVKTAGFVRYLRQNKFTHQALPPAISWKSTPDRSLVSGLQLSGNTLSWDAITGMRYAVYAIPTANRNDADAFTSSKYLLGLTYNANCILPSHINAGTHSLAVSVVDRYGNEFTPRVYNEPSGTAVSTTLLLPENNKTTLLPCLFTWQAVASAQGYDWQLASDAAFTQPVTTRRTVDPSFFSGLQTNLANNTTYYWRVKPHVPNHEGEWSSPFSFVSSRFSILSPTHGEGNISLTPTFTWDNMGTGAEYVFEISSDVRFLSNTQLFSKTLTATSVTVPENILTSYTIYYARVSVSLGAISGVSPTVMFTTEELEIPVPQIITPRNGDIVYGDSIVVTWAPQAANSFRAELSASETFPPRSTKIVSTNAFTYSATFKNLTPATYYLRLKASGKSGDTEPCPTVEVVLETESAIDIFTIEGLDICIIENNDKKVQLVATSVREKQVDLTLFDVVGKALFSKKVTFYPGTNIIDIDNQYFVRGMYFLKIYTNNGMKILKYQK
ncbi:MAG: family 10 glycosylhydrolase [Prevotellaceae bacterium]|jgi:uncharacterized lipoprotein YddW (UPF0748 family)|nr:family 10 glycosylhydrolase [Prevotellaceae bacterium]